MCVRALVVHAHACLPVCRRVRASAYAHVRQGTRWYTYTRAYLCTLEDARARVRVHGDVRMHVCGRACACVLVCRYGFANVQLRMRSRLLLRVPARAREYVLARSLVNA
eukprot:6198295-Pleurochrysis_carterae.AAC.1